MAQSTLISLIAKSKFAQARKVIAHDLEENPQDDYLLIQMANILWNLEKYDEAMSYIMKVGSDATQSAFALFTQGRILMNLQRFDEAVAAWNQILQKPLDEIADDCFGFGVRWAKSVMNDVRYYKAQCLYCLYRGAEALACAKDHLQERQKGIGSDFSRKQVLHFIRLLEYSPEVVMGRSNGECDLPTAPDRERKKINTYLDKYAKDKDHRRMIRYLSRKVAEYPGEYYYWTLLSEYHYLDGNKEQCLKCAEQAYSIIGDEDLLVVYDYGRALYLNGNYPLALDKFNFIVNMDINYIAYHEHGEGLRWARRILKDTKEMIRRTERKCIIN